MNLASRLTAGFAWLLLITIGQGAELTPIRSRSSGSWSAVATWEGGAIPASGSRVQIREGHTVVYDAKSDQAIRFIHVAGTLTFAPDKDTLLNVGVIRIQSGDDATEDGFHCAAHFTDAPADKPKAALEVGTLEKPVDARHTALIRLVYFDGMDKEISPAIVSCGGRMDLHGAPLNRTWLKLGGPAKAGDTEIKLAEPVTGWRVGDRVLLTATTRQIKRENTFRPHTSDNTQTEERLIKAVSGDRLTLDKPLAFDHSCDGPYRGDVANLSRNVIIESADPARARGHTMYHRNSSGSIHYAELRHLGKEGVLGKYSIHFHMVGDSMRGTSVIGASIWDSGNRWITIHGSNYLIVRDCVGYRSVGHGFFLEDGTEVYNVLDRNLAVQAYGGKSLPNQVFPFDHNNGAGFWWANSLNTFTRNVAAECDEYGYRFEATPTPEFSLTLPIAQPDGSRQPVDIRTLPFVRFEDNESHCQRRHAFNLGGLDSGLDGGVAGVGPDAAHPFVIRNMKIWNVHWAFHPMAPSVLVDGMDIHHAEYALWRATYDRHAYRGLRTNDIAVNANFLPKGAMPKAENFPKPLAPVDDLPPTTVITEIRRGDGNTVLVRGTTSDNGPVKRVIVNGVEARAASPNFAEWEAMLKRPDSSAMSVSAFAEDAAGNVEKTPHQRVFVSAK
jgi:hypothetical protein